MPTEADLDAKLAEVSTAISNAAQRVLDEIARLSANHPDLTDEMATLTQQIEALNNIVPATPPVEP